MIRAVMLAAMLACGLSSPALAMSGEELLQSCEVLARDVKTTREGKLAVPRDGEPCWFYMEAIQDVSVIGDGGRRPLIGFCAPEDTTTLQYVRIFLDHARRNPSQLHHNGALVSQYALSRAFPCR